VTPPADRSAEPTSILLDRRRESIEQELVAASGGVSLCTISRSAGSVPGVKYLEGRMAALREIRRAARSNGAIGPVLAERTAVWRSELARAVDSSMGVDWRAYRAGGVDELESLGAVLHG
jgi:hypothetical protein